MSQDKNELAIAPVKSLILKFALPSVIAFLVNSLYSIVDQIFVGNYAGYKANAATSIIFPVFMFSMAVASCISEGGVAYFSLQLGAGHKKISEKIFGNVLRLLIVFPICITVFSYIFLDEMLVFFGATEEIIPLAKDYAKIIFLGGPFSLLGMGLNSFIRADGSPRYAMSSMLVGAILNLILDPIFISVFGWGVKGAAWATVIGETASFIVSVLYLPKFRALKVKLSSLKFSLPIVKKIILYGTSNFFISAAITFVIIVYNNSLNKYGEGTIYGSTIPLSAYALTAKVNQIFMSFMIGLGISLQPIVGYNYGARNYARVKETFIYCLRIAVGIGLLFSIILQIFPHFFVRLFGEGNELYYNFADMSFRIIFSAQMFTAFAIIISNFFRAIGKPLYSILSAGSRFTIFFIPIIYIVPKFLGLKGVLLSTPICEVLSAGFSIWLMHGEMKKLNKLIKNEKKRKGSV